MQYRFLSAPAIALAALFAILGLGGAGCGGDPYVDAFDALCEKACQCGTCAVTDAAGTSTVSFESESACKQLFAFSCGQGIPDPDRFDFDACIADLESAECRTVGDEMAVVSPASCDSD